MENLNMKQAEENQDNIQQKELKNNTQHKKQLETKGIIGLFIQFLKFGLVGISNTLVSGVIYFLMNELWFPGKWFAASLVSWGISVLNAYLWQNIFVFKEDETKKHRVWWQTLFKTYMSYAFTGLFLNNILLWLWTDVIDIAQFCVNIIQFFANIHIGFLGNPETFSSNMGWFINMIISIPLNFIINKFWAYRQKEKKVE